MYIYGILSSIDTNTPDCSSGTFCLYNCEGNGTGPSYVVYKKQDPGHPRITTADDIQSSESCRFCYAPSSVSDYKLIVAVDSVNSQGQQRVLYHNGWSRSAHVQTYAGIEGERFKVRSINNTKLIPHSATSKVLLIDDTQLILGTDDTGDASDFVDIMA